MCGQGRFCDQVRELLLDINSPFRLFLIPSVSTVWIVEGSTRIFEVFFMHFFMICPESHLPKQKLSLTGNMNFYLFWHLYRTMDRIWGQQHTAQILQRCSAVRWVYTMAGTIARVFRLVKICKSLYRSHNTGAHTNVTAWVGLWSIPSSFSRFLSFCKIRVETVPGED